MGASGGYVSFENHVLPELRVSEHALVVDYDIPLPQLIAEGYYDHVSEAITECEFTRKNRPSYAYGHRYGFCLEGKRGQHKVTAEVIGFATGGTIVRRLDIDKVFEERRLTHANLREVLAFGAQFREVHEKKAINALGSARVHPTRWDYVSPWLGHVHEAETFKKIGRAVHASEFGEWTYSYSHFLGIKI